MKITTISLEEHQRTAADQLAARLSAEYKVHVSFAEIVRRALAAYLEAQGQEKEEVNVS